MSVPVLPHFYLKVLNGMHMSFGIVVYLATDRERRFRLFDQYTNNEHHDHRRDLFQQFVNAENAGLLTFAFTVFNDDAYHNMRWMGETDCGPNISRSDCRKWIWNLNGMRLRVQRREPDTGGHVETDYAKDQ